MRAQPPAWKACWDLRAVWGGTGSPSAGNHGLCLEPGPPKSAVGCAQVAPSPVPRIAANAGRESLGLHSHSLCSGHVNHVLPWTHIKPSFCCPPWISADQSPEKPQGSPRTGSSRMEAHLHGHSEGPLPEPVVPCLEKGSCVCWAGKTTFLSLPELGCQPG